MNVTITRLTDPTYLFHQYPGQQESQDCFLALDLKTGQLWCDWNGEIGNAIPESVYHRRTLRWTIPTLTADYANGLMDKVAPLAQRILNGASIEWDGNNHVGRLNADADAAEDEIQAAADGWADDDRMTVTAVDVEVWHADGWDPAPDLGLTADTTYDQLDQMEKAVEDDVRSSAETTVVVQNARRYLEARRKTMRAELREQLEEKAEQIDDLEEERDALIRRIAAWGVDSDRAIAALVGKSHTWVQNVRKASPDPLAERARAEMDQIERNLSQVLDVEAGLREIVGDAYIPPQQRTILDQLNAYTGENIWQDVILRLDGYDETASDAIDQSQSDRFVAGGQVYRFDGQNRRWYIAGEYEGPQPDPYVVELGDNGVEWFDADDVLHANGIGYRDLGGGRVGFGEDAMAYFRDRTEDEDGHITPAGVKDGKPYPMQMWIGGDPYPIRTA